MLALLLHKKEVNKYTIIIFLGNFLLCDKSTDNLHENEFLLYNVMTALNLAC